MKPKVAFICVHNSCRSQMAEAIGRLYGSEVFDSYSAGTEIKSEINKDAVKVIKKLYNIDISEIQHVKLIDDLPEIDIVVKMGCNVACPFLPSKYEEDWGLEDPTGKSDEKFIKTAKIIEEKVKNLIKKIKNKEIKL
ncbi:MAG: arsenate reductase ArsC [Clostridium tyrobutyricum]|uniref:arsenate reductase ArsC n=2 Tax=Clostridium tyrobutyricum TaxID=1519 RepID=UPI00073D853D|nr:arsenate reductase ArsC [Clostridium tyrobutyricum]MBR9649054.1 arsenate reductase ArsC [Clostridium tyrobutyricum]MBV4419232.1 arsenate reductase ArsC [Clostridium tyrobutyricum]MBV4447609.1 arsenate reductase ArsC [Clostridium tyrobutyricum]MCH4198844.1 arsenate reductase ArsC [Clostridium tyrobutyricum]MCH4258307.1 arsenate reductase ArsC [Clostridium tyrobutyricum]